MLSLAPVYFRDVFSDQGGPVLRVQSGEFPIFNENSYQASAYLKPELTPHKQSTVMFGTADGTGSSNNPAVAQHKAIAEALERWAFLQTSRSQDAAKYGFNADFTSNGMAAFPGFAWQARRRARLEALERYALIGWWDGQFSHTLSRAPYPSVGLVRIHHGQSFGEVVVLYHRAPAGFMAYGYASGSTLASAASRAAVELARCEFVISRHRARGSILPVKDAMEKRCLHFATPDGYAQFLERLDMKGTTKASTPWRTLYDGEIRGPWTRWVKVWRQAVEMPTWDFLDARKMFFFW